MLRAQLHFCPTHTHRVRPLPWVFRTCAEAALKTYSTLFSIEELRKQPVSAKAPQPRRSAAFSFITRVYTDGAKKGPSCSSYTKALVNAFQPEYKRLHFMKQNAGDIFSHSNLHSNELHLSVFITIFGLRFGPVHGLKLAIS